DLGPVPRLPSEDLPLQVDADRDARRAVVPALRPLRRADPVPPRQAPAALVRPVAWLRAWVTLPAQREERHVGNRCRLPAARAAARGGGLRRGGVRGPLAARGLDARRRAQRGGRVRARRGGDRVAVRLLRAPRLSARLRRRALRAQHAAAL